MHREFRTSELRWPQERQVPRLRQNPTQTQHTITGGVGDLGHFAGNGRDGDGARDDLCLQGLELVHDVVDVTTRGGVADAVIGEVERVEAAFGRAVVDSVCHLDHSGVDTLEHRGEAVGLLLGGVDEVFVGVHTDGPLALAGLNRSLDGATTRATGRGVDHVGASVVPRKSDFLGLVRGAPGSVVTGSTEVLRLHDDVGVHSHGASDVASLKLLDQVNFLAADETDRAALALQSGSSTDEE